MTILDAFVGAGNSLSRKICICDWAAESSFMSIGYILPMVNDLVCKHLMYFTVYAAVINADVHCTIKCS